MTDEANTPAGRDDAAWHAAQAQVTAQPVGPIERRPSVTTYLEVRAALLARQEIALLDVREEDPFAQAHPLFAANLSWSRLELEA